MKKIGVILLILFCGATSLHGQVVDSTAWRAQGEPVLVTGEDAQAVMKLIQADTAFPLNPYVDGEGAVQDFVPAQ